MRVGGVREFVFVPWDIYLEAKKRRRDWQPNSLIFLCFFEFLAFFFCKEILAFLSVFPFFPRDLRGSPRVKILVFWGGFPCRFPKKQGKEDQGTEPR